MNVQIIERDGSPEWAVLPYAEYERLMARLEDAQDREDAAAIRTALMPGDEERVPAADRLTSGDSPLRVWREHRGMSQQQLAEAAGVSQAMVTMIETGRRTGQVSTLRLLAGALDVDMEDLLAEDEPASD
jgi:DNA-binding XRE family transcriptional regulator